MEQVNLIVSSTSRSTILITQQSGAGKELVRGGSAPTGARATTPS